MKTIIIIFMCYLFCFSCVNVDDSDKQEREKTEVLLSEAQRQIGMPAMINFYEKKLLKILYELRDKSDLICYAYYFNAFEGKRGEFIGKCIGFGLPYSVQFSNPEKEVYRYNGGFGTLPQAEPNGLFMPDSLSATWLMLINPKTNQPEPVYVEPKIIVSPFKMH